MTLFDRRFVILAGKGGVGRTTIAAAFSKAAARRGKRVLLLQTKSKERLSRLFGCAPIGSEVTPVEPNLYAVNMTPEAALREYGTMVLRSEFIARQVLENRFSRAFLHAVPGLEDYSMLGKTWFHTTEVENGKPRWDLVVLDGPATGHVITMLGIPRAILETVPESPLTASARAADALLRDSQATRMVITTLAEELPVNETIELAARARDAIGIELGPIVVNRLMPARFSAPHAREVLATLTPSSGSALDDMLDAARLLDERRRAQESALAHLGARLALPRHELPQLFVSDFGPAQLAELADRLESQLLNTEAAA